MERSAAPRQRHRDNGQAPPSPARHIRNKSSAQAPSQTTTAASISSSNRIHANHNDDGTSTSRGGRKSMDDQRRHFIGNVGAGGTLYLKPSRLPQHQVNVHLATPPDTSYGPVTARQSTASGIWTPHPKGMPPVSIANVHRRRQTRSRSISTIEDGVAEGLLKPRDVRDTDRPASSSAGLLNLQIPHYRLGTPQFSEIGTAYLHNSAHASSINEDRSSVLSQPAYDRLFPVLPRRSGEHNQSSPHHLHPSAALSPHARSKSSLKLDDLATAAAIFDRLEANPNDPSSVRLSSDGRFLAASVPRLIVQVTSPNFLDYELLSDFFLTYRDFLSGYELLSWLLVRMRWAIINTTDAGRIVRVRTFVALRHWILNYFSNDFVSSYELRYQFCDSVNQLARDLERNGSNGDLNIIGELKKCWRRTSALFWPAQDAMDSSATEEIMPGGLRSGPAFDTSHISLPETMREVLHIESTPTILATPQLIALDQRTNQRARVASINSTGSAALLHPGSIPASPMSEESLQVLSCSVPFLQRVRPDAQADQLAQQSAPRPVMLQRQNSLTRRPRSSQHRRSESDAAVSRHTHDSAASPSFEQLPTITLTGGLVRGLLLKPSPVTIQGHAPRSPPLQLDTPGDDYFEDGGSQHAGVKRIVDDMRRALSVKKAASESSGKSLHSGSSGSRASNHLRDVDPPRSEPSETARSGTSITRGDMLAGLIEKSYEKHFIQDAETRQHDQDAPLRMSQLGRSKVAQSGAANRLDSQITTSSRSIVIVDATSFPPPPAQEFDLPPFMPLFPGIPDMQRSSATTPPKSPTSLHQGSVASVNSFGHGSSIDGRLHESYVFPPSSGANKASEPPGMLRKSSEVHGLHEMRSMPNQLRRRPGGDLKAADHVHELEPQDDMQSPTDSFAGLTIASVSSSVGLRSPRPKSGRTTQSIANMDRSSSQPHLRPSFRSDAYRLANVRTSSEGGGGGGSSSGGGVEDALARLEGKSNSRRRHSGMSWLELPTNKEVVERAGNGEEQGGTAFEIVNTGLSGQIYRISQADFSEETSLRESSYANTTYMPAASYEPPIHNGASVHGHAVSSPVLTVQSSFLLDDNQSLSDISTDIAEDGDEDSQGVRSFFFEDTADDEGARPPVPVQPAHQHDEPDARRVQPLKIASSAAKLLGVPAGILMSEVTQSRQRRHRPVEKGYQHYPFILAFESTVIAEQLCIVEKDAMDEVDWKDLIALNWQHSPSNIRNWADYLKQEESNGIDLVVARFNLVVKWAISECVLVESVVERARCITKYIHIAAHCLRLRNYASMAQITLALLSSDLTRLQKTWTFVLPADKRMLDRLEILCRPLRNFQNLRAEMETASLADGCIPFIGLYTHDLTYNAQKPAWLKPMPPSNDNPSLPALVNFDRYQTAATITKSLLRLLDASAKYVFRPHAEVLSRCLWLAALDDAEISEISLALE